MDSDRGQRAVTRRRRLWVAWLAIASAPLAAAPGGIDSVLISKTADTADLEIRFACPNRLLGPSSGTASVRTEIELMRLSPCVGSGDAINDATRPPGRALAALEEIEYKSPGGTEAKLGLRFDRPVLVTVEQSGDLRGLRVLVRAPAGSVPTATTGTPLPAIAPPVALPALSPEQVARAEERARLATQPKAAAAATDDFVLNLRSTIKPIDLRTETAGIAQQGRVIYVADIKVNDQVWHRLRLGFFATEEDANVAFNALRPRYPEGWVTRVSAAERQAARGGTTVAGQDEVAATAGPGPGTAMLTEVQAAAMLEQARGAILDQDYARAIQLSTRILEGRPPAETAEARELLGLARERNGQVASAIAEYRRYIADYPEGEGANRVWQRLAALTTAREQPRESIRGNATEAPASAWDAYGGISQYYARDSVSFGGESGSVDQAALFSDADLVVRYTGERFDFESRGTVGYNYDMSGGANNPDNQAWVYNLYVDVNDRDLGLSARLGRQTLRSQGVLGRFDGALVSWQLAPSYRLNVLAGYPVYQADQSIDTSRRFYGVSVDMLNLLGTFDVNVFLNVQEVDGVNDREAVGAEIRYFGQNKSFITSVDYDYGYGELNNVVGLGNWTFDNRLTVNGRFDWRNNPYLTTETALVGQSASSIQGLLLTYSEGEIRQLALDRAGAVQSVALGAARPVSERFQISADVTASQYDGTPASGGVQGTPNSGTLIYSYLSVIGSSLIREGDVSILGLRYSDGGTGKSAAIFLDTRYPLTPSLRLNPKMLISRQEIPAGNYTELVVRPGMGVLYRMGRHFQFEFDAGGEFGRSESGSQSNNSTGYYLNIGYSADF